MPAPGAQFGSLIGPDNCLMSLVNYGGGITYAMAALNTGLCFRFTATSTNDIKSVRLFWSSVLAPGTDGITLRIETVDATTGKPSGTLYDANATITFTATANIQTYTFVTLPTTGLIIGNEYAIVLLTVVAGTTQTIGAYFGVSMFATYPTIPLTAVDGTTRSNFAEVSTSRPCCSLVDESDVEIPSLFFPYITSNPGYVYFYGTTNFVAQKFIINTSVDIAGICFAVAREGTPAGDVRIRIFDSSNNVIAGTTLIIDKDSMTGANIRRVATLFPSVITLISGTYRIVFDSSASLNSSNAFGLRALTFLNSAAVNPWRLSTSSDAANWTDSTTAQTGVWLLLNNFVVGGGGGVVSNNMRGGFING